MGTMESQITSLNIVHSTIYSDANQGKHQSSLSLAFVLGIHRGPVNSPHKWPVTRKIFLLDDVIIWDFNSLVPGRSGCNDKNANVNLVLQIGIFMFSSEDADEHHKTLLW